MAKLKYITLYERGAYNQMCYDIMNDQILVLSEDEKAVFAKQMMDEINTIHGQYFKMDEDDLCKFHNRYFSMILAFVNDRDETDKLPF